MVRIAWAMVRHRPASMLATLLALGFAVAMVTTCGALLESGVRFHGSVARYAAAPVLVAHTEVQVSEGTGEDRDVERASLAARPALPAALVARVTAAPGVRAVVADTELPGEITSGSGPTQVALHPWSAASLTPFRLAAGRPPAAAGQAVLEADLAARLHLHPGDRLRLAAGATTRTLVVAGTAAPAGARPDQPTLFVTDAQLRALGARGPQVLGAFPQAGVDTSALARSVRAALPRPPAQLAGSYPHVFSGAQRGSVETLAVGDAREYVIALSSVFGGATMMIAIFVIAGTVGLSVQQRHRDIALLRAIAATPRQVRRMVVREAALLAVVAAALGVWPGLAATGWLADQFVARGLAPDSFSARLSWLPPTVAAGAALLAAVTAAWGASLRASRIRPTAALAESAVERRGIGWLRTIAGLVALAGGGVLCVVSAHLGQDAVAVAIGTITSFVLGIGLLSPVLVRTAAVIPGCLLRLCGVPGRLATANTAASGRRLSAVLVSLVLALALGGSLWFVFGSAKHAATEQARAGLRASTVVSAPGGLPASAEHTARTVPGVTAVTGVVRSTIFAAHGGVESLTAQGLDVRGLTRTMDLDVTRGDLGDLGAGTVAVDRLTADELHLHVGGTFTGWFADGTPARLRVVAIYARGLGFAEFTTSRATLAAHTSSGRDDALFVADDGRAGTGSRLRAALNGVAPGVEVVSCDGYRAQLATELTENAWANQVIIAVLLVYVVIAAGNTLVMYALDRRRDFGVLRLAGTTARQVLRMVLVEQVLLLSVALLVGGAIAAAALVPSVKAMTGSATPYIPATGWATVLGGLALLGTVASLLPARRMLRTRPVQAVAVRE